MNKREIPNRVFFGIMTLLFNAYGVPCFMQGRVGDGIKRILISALTLGVGAVVLAIIGIVNGVRILCMSQEAFEHYWRAPRIDKHASANSGADYATNFRGQFFVHLVIYAFLIVMALIVLFPFYWMIISSLKTLSEYRQAVPTFWPNQIIWGNYAEAFTTANLGRLFLNTAYVGIVSTILSLIITVLSAFAFARLEFKGKETMFAMLLATMMIPGELFTITNYITVNNLGWMNTFTALIVPFLVSVFYIYLLRQNFMQIPNELYLAAKVDGCSDLKYLWKVMIPLALPTLISITILKMMGAWNSYIWPKLVANDGAHDLITNGLRNAFTDTSGQANYPVQMAAVALVSAPLFLVFLFLRKYIMKGVSRSGIKG